MNEAFTPCRLLSFVRLSALARPLRLHKSHVDGWANWPIPKPPRYQTLLHDPTFTPIGNRDRRATESDTKRRTFFSNTLWTDTTIRSTQCFYKGFIRPERWTGDPRPASACAGPGECRQVFSLGQGLGGGTSRCASWLPPTEPHLLPKRKEKKSDTDEWVA